MKILKSRSAVTKAANSVLLANVNAIGQLVSLNTKETAIVCTDEATADQKKAFGTLRNAIKDGLIANGYAEAIGCNANTLTGHINKWLAGLAGVEDATVASASDHFVAVGLTKGRAKAKAKPKARVPEANSAIAKEIAAYLRRHRKVLATLPMSEKMALMQIIKSA